MGTRQVGSQTWEPIGPDGLPEDDTEVEDAAGMRIFEGRTLVYEGGWSRGKPNGQGRMVFRTGEYVGDIRDGHAHGQGKVRWNDGTTHQGGFRHHRPHGRGMKTYPDGTVASGTWTAGERAEIALRADDGLKRETEGNLKETIAKRHGRRILVRCASKVTGLYRAKNESGYVYIGELSEGKANGIGHLTCPNRIRYEGKWKDGHPVNVERVNLPGWEERCIHAEVDRVSKMTLEFDAIVTTYRCECGGKTANPQNHGKDFMGALGLLALVFIFVISESFWWGVLNVLLAVFVTGGLFALYDEIEYGSWRCDRYGPWLDTFWEVEEESL